MIKSIFGASLHQLQLLLAAKPIAPPVPREPSPDAPNFMLMMRCRT